MRYLTIIILLTFISSSCRSDKCTQSLSADFDMSVLSLWEKQTAINLAYRKNDTLISFFKSAERDSISLFDRERFIGDVSNMEEIETLKFDSLVVAEVNSSGEVYLQTKYLIAFCGEQATVVKFQRGQKKWEFIQVHKADTNNINVAINTINKREDSSVYWGGNINDIVAISKFQSRNKVSVEVFSTLNEMQYKALGIIEK